MSAVWHALSGRITPLIVAIPLGLAACATPKEPVYHYGSYARTLYHSKKNTSPELLAKHQHELLSIIAKSKERGLRVPPGIYCEYGWLIAHEGKVAEAEAYLALEQQTYPESVAFVGFLRSQLSQNTSR